MTLQVLQLPTQGFIGMLSLRLLLKVLDMTFGCLNFTLYRAEILPTLSKLFLYGDLVNLEIGILL